MRVDQVACLKDLTLVLDTGFLHEWLLAREKICFVGRSKEAKPQIEGFHLVCIISTVGVSDTSRRVWRKGSSMGTAYCNFKEHMISA